MTNWESASRRFTTKKESRAESRRISWKVPTMKSVTLPVSMVWPDRALCRGRLSPIVLDILNAWSYESNRRCRCRWLGLGCGVLTAETLTDIPDTGNGNQLLEAQIWLEDGSGSSGEAACLRGPKQPADVLCGWLLWRAVLNTCLKTVTC